MNAPDLQHVYVVIMAGGSGERFWPLSRTTHPKQLLRLVHPHLTMLEQAVQRIAPLVPMERILIVTSDVLQGPIREAMPDLPAHNVIAEPAKRNTAPCLALAAVEINRRASPPEHAVMAVLTADHFIGDEEAFRRDIALAIDYAQHHSALVTLGIPPTRPETGYGYIELGDVAQGVSKGVHRVASFREKPDASTAATYVDSGRYLWNAGMFFWRVVTLQAAMQQHLPEIGAWMATSADIAATFHELPNISIDYGVMERANNVVVVPASFPWDDVGSWDALLRMAQRDEHGNVLQGACSVVDTTNSVIVNARTDQHILTAVGLDSHILVATNEATMMCPLDRAQDVKLIVAALRAQGRNDVL